MKEMITSKSQLIALWRNPGIVQLYDLKGNVYVR